MLAVARALAARGHQVTFSSALKHVRDAAREGLRFVEMPIIAGSTHERLRPYEDSEDMARAFLGVLDSERPDVVIADLLTLGPAIAAQARGIPLASLLVHALHSPSRELPPFGWGRPPGRAILRLRDAWLRAGNRRTLARARDDLNAVRARFGIEPTDRLDAQISGELAIVATLPSLEIPRNDWPSYAHVVGPCLYDPGGDPVELPSGDAPLILIAASTAHEHDALVSASLNAVSALGARAVLTTGKSIRPEALPPGVVATPFASHDAILSSARAAICNGGHGIVARALTLGVPLVVVPGHGDQQENAYRVVRAGAGLAVKKPTDRGVQRALRAVLTEPHFAAAARRVSAEAAGLDGPTRAAELVEDLYLRRPGRPDPRIDVS
jgi:MGT family glycosyltransferase